MEFCFCFFRLEILESLFNRLSFELFVDEIFNHGYVISLYAMAASVFLVLASIVVDFGDVVALIKSKLTTKKAGNDNSCNVEVEDEQEDLDDEISPAVLQTVYENLDLVSRIAFDFDVSLAKAREYEERYDELCLAQAWDSIRVQEEKILAAE